MKTLIPFFLLFNLFSTTYAQVYVDKYYDYAVVYENQQAVDTISFEFTGRNEIAIVDGLIYRSFTVQLIYDPAFYLAIYRLDHNSKLERVNKFGVLVPDLFHFNRFNLLFEKGFLVFYYSEDPDMEVRHYEEKLDLFELSEENFKGVFHRLLIKILQDNLDKLNKP